MQILNFILFNPFANALVNQTEKMLPLPIRTKSMILDFARSMGIVFPFAIPIILLIEKYWSMAHGFYLFWPLLILVMFNKDIVNGRSITKRKLGFVIVKNNSESPASQLQCFFRNITCFIWPLEGLISLSGDSRRIGDIIAGTKVIEQPTKSNSTFTSELLKIRVSIELIFFNFLVIVTGIVFRLIFKT